MNNPKVAKVVLLTVLDNRGERMLKTYRVIPLVFILFLFVFTFITVSPLLALSSEAIRANQEVERNIRELGDLICDHHPESKHESCIAYQNMKERRRNFKDPSRVTQEDVDAMYRELEEEHKSLKTHSPTAQTALFANQQMGNFAVLAFQKFVHGQSVRRNSKKQRNERNACSSLDK